MINYLLALVLAWIIGFVVHEYGHYIEASFQGCSSSIRLWFYRGWIPSLRCDYSGTISNRNRFLLSGGLVAGVVCVFLATLMFMYSRSLAYGFGAVGTINLFYAWYEVSYLDSVDRDNYMKGHYLLYFIVWFIFTFLWYQFVVV